MTTSRRRTLKRFAVRALLVLAGLLVVGAAGGAVYEARERGRAVREFPPPGRMVDVGGRRIQVDCRGAGSPTVVLENGLDRLGSPGWAAVHDGIARTTRVCAYSRAGIMWSDPAPGPFRGERVAADLHAALAAAGERAPWVLVGHSLGGPYALTFTGRYGGEVAGVVLVDASHPDQGPALRGVFGEPESRLGRTRQAFLLAARAGLARLGFARLEPVPPPLPFWSESQADAWDALYPASAAAFLDEARAGDASMVAAGPHRRLGDRPLVVLTAGAVLSPAVVEQAGMTPEGYARFRVVWARLQAEMAAWSTRGRQVRLEDAGHYVHHDRPDAVVRAVGEVVDAVRAAIR